MWALRTPNFLAEPMQLRARLATAPSDLGEALVEVD
jgi:hypothetical protein